MESHSNIIEKLSKLMNSLNGLTDLVETAELHLLEPKNISALLELHSREIEQILQNLRNQPANNDSTAFNFAPSFSKREQKKQTAERDI